MSEAIVVGAGPNGLACGAELARRGLRVTVVEAAQRVGGGTRTSELTIPGLLHDDCAATHPLAVAVPALRRIGVERHGLEWAWPEVDLAHPFDDRDAATMVRSIDATAAGLGADGNAWRRIFGPTAEAFDELAEDAMVPLLRIPGHPLRLARFGLPAALPATVLARSFRARATRALFGGVAAHAFARLTWPFTSAIGSMLISSCHHAGWPVARGGSQAIADALAAVIREHGGRVETGRAVRSLDELPAVDAVVFDLAPGAVAEIAGGRLPDRVARAYRRYRHGPGAFKLDLAVEGGVPWRDPAVAQAGTVHVIGSFEELVVAEDQINSGRMPERPFIVLGQQYLADPSRSRGDVHPVWAYAHVPSRYSGDATEAMLDQIERFAPGLRERIVARHVRSTLELASYNPNFVGGDIAGGAVTPLRTMFRPRFALDPYWTGIPGVFICSAATPPGAGAHGICGYNAAQSVLRKLGAA